MPVTPRGQRLLSKVEDLIDPFTDNGMKTLFGRLFGKWMPALF
jgi:hypothetical protein